MTRSWDDVGDDAVCRQVSLVERPSRFWKLYDITGGLSPGDVMMTS